jgi:aldose 1-epimerase
VVRRISLSCGQWRADIAPEIGGSILSLAHAGRAILRATPEEAVAERAVRRTACFPLVPYANRIADGCFAWDGQSHRLAENFPASPHPLHGIGWRRAWIVVSAGVGDCTIRLEHRPHRDEQDWPFAFDAEQRISLGADGLQVELSVSNVHARPAPLGLGLHPLFPRRGDERLTFDARGAWRNGADMLPAARVSGELWDHAAGQAIGAQNLDNDFVDWQGTARIESGSFPAIRIRATPIFSCLRVFTPPDKDFFAVEPVSHSTDAINRNRGPELLRVQSGERLCGTVTINVEAQ